MALNKYVYYYYFYTPGSIDPPGVIIDLTVIGDLEYRVATFALSQSGMGIRGYHPRKMFGIPYAIWCISRQSGGSYL